MGCRFIAGHNAHSYTPSLYSSNRAFNSMLLGDGEGTENIREPHADTGSNVSSGSNQEAWSCEASVLPTTPLSLVLNITHKLLGIV